MSECTKFAHVPTILIILYQKCNAKSPGPAAHLNSFVVANILYLKSQKITLHKGETV